MKDEFCMTCTAVITPVLSTRRETIAFRGECFEIDAKAANCPACGESFLTAESHDANLAALQQAYREAHSLVSPDEIKAIRQKYGLSQAKFAKVLGLGAKTITRYENGYIPDEAYSNLIQFSADPNNMMEHIQRRENHLELSKAEVNDLLACIKRLIPEDANQCITVEKNNWYVVRDGLNASKEKETGKPTWRKGMQKICPRNH